MTLNREFTDVEKELLEKLKKGELDTGPINGKHTIEIVNGIPAVVIKKFSKNNEAGEISIEAVSRCTNDFSRLNFLKKYGHLLNDQVANKYSVNKNKGE